MDDAGAPDNAELRLALGMRGGVSLAVWIGGACAEIDALRRAADDRTGFWWEVLSASPYSRVVVDVMAGASAGGLNGVLFAAGIRHGFRMGDLGGVWSDVAAIDELRRQGPPWLSLFDGDVKFLDVIRAALDRLVGDAPGAPTGAEDAYVDLQLSATLLEPVVQAAATLRDEKLKRSRSDARFHFRHDPAAALPRRDLEAGSIPQLAVAARGTASFPGAFEAAVVRSRRPPRFRSVRSVPPRDPASGERLADCHGVFSESRGRLASTPGPVDAHIDDDDFLVADGGVVDNIPLGKALDAIRDAPADRPTRRVLVYLHPTGPAVGSQKVPPPRDETPAERVLRRRGPLAVGRGLMAAKLQDETIDGDLERIEEHNQRVQLGETLRSSLLVELAEPGAPPATTLAESRRRPYALQRAGADADAVHALLRDPVVVLGEDPFPYLGEDVTLDDRWRAPLSNFVEQQRENVRGDLRDCLVGGLSDENGGRRDLLNVGLGPSTRSIRLLIELARAAETQVGREAPGTLALLGQVKGALYELASLVQEMDRVRRLGWVVSAGQADPTTPAWVGATVTCLDQLLQVEQGTAAAILAPRAAGGTAAREAYFSRADEALQRWSEGTAPVALPGQVVDIRAALVEALYPMVVDILQALDENPPPVSAAAGATGRSGAEVIQRVLLDEQDGAPPADAAELGRRLEALEVLLVQEHLLGDPGASRIGFERMSAAAATIDAYRFTKLYERSVALDPEATFVDADHLLPNVKLAGNELGSFSAFLSRKWRVNDWTWGRMDAVETLVDLLLGLDRPAEERRAPSGYREIAPPTGDTPSEELDVRRALIRRRQDEIFEEAVAPSPDKLPADRAEWDMGVEDLTHPGSTAIARSVAHVGQVAGLVIGEALPPSFPRVAPQLRGILGGLARRFAKPKGGLPPLPGQPPPVVDKGFPWTPLFVAVGIGVLVAAVLWALAASIPAFLIGVVAGLVPGAVLLWLALQGVLTWIARALARPFRRRRS